MKLNKIDNKNRRIQKKLYLGEFAVLCFQIDCKLSTLEEASLDAFTDDLLDAAEERGLCVGGGGTFGSFFACIFPQQRYQSATEEDVQALTAWFEARTDVEKFTVSPLMDSNDIH